MRLATAADAPALAAMLGRAFANEPMIAWVCPRPARREAFARRFFALRLRQTLAHEEVWMAGGGEAAALWFPPERWRLGLRETLRAARPFVEQRCVRRVALALPGLARAERRHPDDPHLYLAVLGTDPPHQGRGHGSAVLAPMLELCDRDVVPAYLETAKERNVAYYARHGFRVIEQVRMPRGPLVRLMWREPR